MVFMRFAWMVTYFYNSFLLGNALFSLCDFNYYRCNQGICFFLPVISQTLEHRSLRVCGSSSTRAKRKRSWLENNCSATAHSGQESLGQVFFFVSFVQTTNKRDKCSNWGAQSGHLSKLVAILCTNEYKKSFSLTAKTLFFSQLIFTLFRVIIVENE